MSEQKRLALAVVLSGIILFGWQSLFPPAKIEKNPTAIDPQQTTNTAQTNSQTTNTSNTTDTINQVKPTKLAKRKLKSWVIDDGEIEVQINNDLTFKEIDNRLSGQNLTPIAGSHTPLSIEFLVGEEYRKLIFSKLTQATPERIEASNEEYQLKFIGFIKEGALSWQLYGQKPFRYRFVLNSVSFGEEAESDPQIGEIHYGAKREFVYFNGEAHRIAVADEENIEGTLVKWFGLDFNYHLLSVIFPDRESLRMKAFNNSLYVSTTKDVLNLSGKIVFTKKDYDKLVALGDNLSAAVDFGVFAILAVPLLRGLQGLYKLIPNYGIAIILLTLFVRLLLFPLNYKSFKSMKKMQKVQPELAKLREKYKEDPRMMQQKSMELFKRHGANPMSGCLPMILQMPVFFAFYAVLYNAVELVDAPFLLWISDLSVKDPLYVLPVLMSAAMFFQQKLMPTSATADPAQQKIMMFMPIIFGFLMMNLPSGLTLYIFISTLFGILQQFMVYKTVE